MKCILTMSSTWHTHCTRKFWTHLHCWKSVPHFFIMFTVICDSSCYGRQ